MPIRVECTCGTRLKVAHSAAGRTLMCPGCGGPFTVDAGSIASVPETARKAVPPAAGLAVPPATAVREEPSAFQELVSMMADDVQPSRLEATPLSQRTASVLPRRSHVTVTARTGKTLNPFGLASFLFGLIGLLICWVPYLNLIVLPLLGVGLGLGVIGVLTARVGGQSGLEWPLSGVGMCVLGIVAVFGVTGFVEAGRRQALARVAVTAEADRTRERVELAEQSRRLEAARAADERAALAERERKAERETAHRKALLDQEEAEAARLLAREKEAREKEARAKAEATRREAEEAARLEAVQDEIDERRREKIAAQEAELEATKTARRKAVTRLAEAGRLLADGETEKALAIYLRIIDDYPNLVESDNARLKVRELSPKLKADPKYAARFDKVDPNRRQRDLERQLAEKKAEIARKARNAHAGRQEAAAMAPAAAATATQVQSANQKVLEENARRTDAYLRGMRSAP